MHQRPLPALGFFVLAGLALSSPAFAQGAVSGGAPLGDLPASFEGTLPCADCPGILYHLDLFPDQVFYLRLTYSGRGEGRTFDDIGSWMLDSNTARLQLKGGGDGGEQFAVVDDRTLRKLDVAGRPIESGLNYDLTRQATPSPIEPRVASLRGMYRYMADAGLFEECLTGRRLRVAMEEDNAALERAYLAARVEPGATRLVTLAGRFAMRPRMEGTGMIETLVVERFEKVWPGETCGARFLTAALSNTYWKLTRLGGEPVAVGERQREPHLTFQESTWRVTGWTGCNRMTGSFRSDPDRLTIGQMATTRMACADGEAIERGFIAALDRTRRWKISGEHLELYDEQGSMLARLEARALP